MICVSIGRTRHKMMIAEHKALAEKGAELVELRLDWLSHLPDLKRLLVDRPTPAIVTCRRKSDKGLWKGTEEQRLMILRSAIVSGVDYVDLEEDTAGTIRRYGKTKRIISYHNFDETPYNLEEIHARLAKCDADIVKLATMANSPHDNVRMLKLVAGAKIPTVAFCMGELGIISRVLTGRYGAPFSFATFSKDRTLAPGQLSFDEMRFLYRYDQINEKTGLYGVLGDPIAHSLSPIVHNSAFLKEGLNKVYFPLRVPKDLLLNTLEQFQWLNFQGYSVTLPHKETVLGFTKNYEGPIKEIGAANTLFRNGEGNWCATNTDYDAALDSLKAAMQGDDPPPPANSPHPIAGKKVMIMGAGGAARAIGWAISKAGGVLMISNRTKQRGEELATHLGCQYVGWENRAAHFTDILINCTSVGMHPNLNETPYLEHWLREGMLVFDTVYNPEQTLLIKLARERGCRTVTGVEMFVRQAARQFELFTDKQAPLEIMRKTFRKAISAVQASE